MRAAVAAAVVPVVVVMVAGTGVRRPVAARSVAITAFAGLTVAAAAAGAVVAAGAVAAAARPALDVLPRCLLLLLLPELDVDPVARAGPVAPAPAPAGRVAGLCGATELVHRGGPGGRGGRHADREKKYVGPL